MGEVSKVYYTLHLLLLKLLLSKELPPAGCLSVIWTPYPSKITPQDTQVLGGVIS